ncbi:DUF6320 domain-containing protein [Labilibaculum sp.]|uniref:zinc ribbon domain-containing protein n=1 Tax=Labilibaculum sp. TaxID=2060723 RepID=UPI003561CF0E
MNSEMNYCNKCGVELDDNMNFCPLCGLSIGEKSEESESSISVQSMEKDKIIDDFEKLSQVQKRKLFWELSNIILLSGILVTITINLFLNKSITWSSYSTVTSLAVLANISIFTFWRHRMLVMVLGSLVSTSLLLILLDLFSTNVGWGIKLGIPILLSFYLLLLLVIGLIRISKQVGFNILAIAFLAIGIFSICVDGFVSLYFIHQFQIRWSIIVSISMIPISGLLFYVHYRLKKGVDLKRFFHI